MIFAQNTEGDKLILRFRLEPRASYMHSSACWLVAFDMKQGEYVKNPGKRSYMTFKDSEAAWRYLRTII